MSNIVSGPRPVVVQHSWPECHLAEVWVTFRGAATATLFCPECQHAWVEEVHNHPALAAVPHTQVRIR